MKNVVSIVALGLLVTGYAEAACRIPEGEVDYLESRIGKPNNSVSDSRPYPARPRL